nr:hypothetical protein [Pantoea sp. NGS-ED-1003]
MAEHLVEPAADIIIQPALVGLRRVEMRLQRRPTRQAVQLALMFRQALRKRSLDHSLLLRLRFLVADSGTEKKADSGARQRQQQNRRQRQQHFTNKTAAQARGKFGAVNHFDFSRSKDMSVISLAEILQPAR